LQIEKRPEPEILVKMKDCGNRNVNGVELALVGNEQRHLEANFGEFPWMIGILEKEFDRFADLLIYIGGLPGQYNCIFHLDNDSPRPPPSREIHQIEIHLCLHFLKSLPGH